MRAVAGALFLSIFFCCTAHAQQVILSTDTAKLVPVPIVHIVKPKKPKPLRHEFSGGIRLNTDGFSIFTHYGWLKTADVKHVDMFHSVLYLELEFSEKKDPREIKSQSVNTNSFGGSSNYVYGKINNLYTLKIGGIGYRKQLAGKPDVGSVSIHWANSLGLSVAFLKPYYLDVTTQADPIKYSTSTEQDFLTQSVIEGNAGFTKGLSEVKIIPGGFLKSALHFDFSTNRKNVLGVEAGGDLELYSQAMQLMAFQEPKSLYANLFVSFQYGRRW